MKDVFENKTILVTGGCGSIGSEIVRQLLDYNPEVVRVFDSDEAGHFKLSQKIKSSKVRHLIGDIRDRDRLIRAMEGVDIVFHAAALKHVHLCEYNPFEAVSTNVIGTQNLIDAAINARVDKVVGISTDKAVNPINTMGATKLLSEKIIISAPIGKSNVKFCCVRFGNVLSSVGSVMPIFEDQIKKGGPITITDENMTRFFMSMSDAVNLVLKAATETKGGETFIFKMKSLRIKDLAHAMVELLALGHGKNPEEIGFEIIGTRPGEKLSESLVSLEEIENLTELDDMFVLKNPLQSGDFSGNQKNNPAEGMKKVNINEYNSAKVPLLSKEEIKRTLQEQKII